jgi:anti-sigma regulatory factor (Ser/Thr protein kinase)
MARMIGISRQAVSKQLRDLITSRLVVKKGATRGARFRRIKPGEKLQREGRFARKLLLKDLEEDRIFSELSILLNLRSDLSSDALGIVRYAFTEILNNAIEHSRSLECHVDFSLEEHDARFAIRDFGIGAYHSIQTRFDLADEGAAVAELLKGKATTMAERHSGEGIFFTSRVADSFTLRSHRISLVFESSDDKVRVEEGRFLKGTMVRFAISSRSRRKLQRVFQKYAPEEYDFKFERTRVLVRIYTGECVSRSEAKRMLLRLENFREVELDFRGVAVLGQAFADEVFRVFLRGNPDMIFQLKNVKPALKPMIQHVSSALTAERIVFID